MLRNAESSHILRMEEEVLDQGAQGSDTFSPECSSLPLSRESKI